MRRPHPTGCGLRGIGARGLRQPDRPASVVDQPPGAAQAGAGGADHVGNIQDSRHGFPGSVRAYDAGDGARDSDRHAARRVGRRGHGLGRDGGESRARLHGRVWDLRAESARCGRPCRRRSLQRDRRHRHRHRVGAGRHCHQRGELHRLDSHKRQRASERHTRWHRRRSEGPLHRGLLGQNGQGVRALASVLRRRVLRPTDPMQNCACRTTKGSTPPERRRWSPPGRIRGRA